MHIKENEFNIYEFIKEYDNNNYSELDTIPINEDLKTYLKGVNDE
tara:strand:- start:362 stop:496 length:135 start_codon:yes stop_codon:yes gene_type:complete